MKKKLLDKVIIIIKMIYIEMNINILCIVKSNKIDQNSTNKSLIYIFFNKYIESKL